MLACNLFTLFYVKLSMVKLQECIYRFELSRINVIFYFLLGKLPNVIFFKTSVILLSVKNLLWKFQAMVVSYVSLKKSCPAGRMVQIFSSFVRAEILLYIFRLLILIFQNSSIFLSLRLNDRDFLFQASSTLQFPFRMYQFVNQNKNV